MFYYVASSAHENEAITVTFNCSARNDPCFSVVQPFNSLSLHVQATMQLTAILKLVMPEILIQLAMALILYVCLLEIFLFAFWLTFILLMSASDKVCLVAV